MKYKPNGGAFPQGVNAIPFVVVSNTGDPVDITITHGSDGKWQGDKQGYARVDFNGKTYLHKRNDNYQGTNPMQFL
ncbi:hypothetical protein GALMADRAFT_255346 [Galerina marginata CBS 339.88]|uniref:Uncharacterized protein n=1 Tax=Galerina marginata (strain CBS 339.88) TaxID=685588 RepID=A0A067STD6_GALM3|nr:hypothetical protein GALMADRAFT_255346 [Galerina marginata CBS 339.88]